MKFEPFLLALNKQNKDHNIALKADNISILQGDPAEPFVAPTHVLTPSTFTKPTGPKVQSSKRSKSPFGGDWQASQGEMERKIKEQEEQVSSLTQIIC